MRGQVVTRGSLVLALAVVLQYAILVRISFRGSHADFMVLLPFGAGYVAGPERGAAFGFVSGLVADLFLPTPFGMSALVGCLVGYLSGMAASGLVRPAWWVPLFGGVGATAISLGLYAMLGYVLGQPAMLDHDLFPALAVALPGSFVLALPAVRLVSWALRPAGRTRPSFAEPAR